LPLNIFESELPYSNPFRTTTCQMTVILQISAKIGCHGNILEKSEEEVHIDHLQ